MADGRVAAHDEYVRHIAHLPGTEQHGPAHSGCSNKSDLGAAERTLGRHSKQPRDELADGKEETGIDHARACLNGELDIDTGLSERHFNSSRRQLSLFG